MEKVIVSKEKCLHCLYGVTGECEMYDEMGKPMDGETCSNYEEAGEDEMIEGERLANGEITIDDCIAYLTEQQEFHDPLSASGRRIQKSISYLREYKERMNVWHSIDEKADGSKYVVLYDVDGGYMSPPSRCILGFDSMFINAMNKKHGANYTMWAYKDDLVPNKKED